MGTLTKNERDGLDEVFMSIHSRVDKYEKMKIEFENFLKHANIGFKDSKITQYILEFTKKKKNLSK